MTATAISPSAKQEIAVHFGPGGYLDKPEDRKLYEYDGSIDKALPDLIVFPRSTADVVFLVNWSRKHDVPIVGRGAGTGLRGALLPALAASPLPSPG